MKYTRHTIYILVFIKLPGDLLFCLFRFIFCGTHSSGKTLFCRPLNDAVIMVTQHFTL